MTVPDEVVYLINVHKKFEGICHATAINDVFAAEVNHLVKDGVVSAAARDIVVALYKNALVSGSAPKATTLSYSGQRGSRGGGC